MAPYDAASRSTGVCHIATLIPERTIDAWTSSAITARQPRALIWAPTPPAQAPTGNQPWDFAVGTPHKLLVIENKALVDTGAQAVATRVQLGMDQLDRLFALEVLNGLPVFYGLPGLLAKQLPRPIPPEPFVERAGWRLSPPFADWQRMVRPTELLSIPQVFAAWAPRHGSVTIDNALVTPFRTLSTLLDDALGCKEGVRLPNDPRSAWSLGSPPGDRLLGRAIDTLLREGISPSADLSGRLREVLARPDFAEATEQQAAEQSVNLHLGRAMWFALPTAPNEPKET
jgi:hypothetical protein